MHFYKSQRRARKPSQFVLVVRLLKEILDAPSPPIQRDDLVRVELVGGEVGEIGKDHGRGSAHDLPLRITPWSPIGLPHYPPAEFLPCDQAEGVLTQGDRGVGDALVEQDPLPPRVRQTGDGGLYRGKVLARRHQVLPCGGEPSEVGLRPEALVTFGQHAAEVVESELPLDLLDQLKQILGIPLGRARSGRRPRGVQHECQGIAAFDLEQDIEFVALDHLVRHMVEQFFLPFKLAEQFEQGRIHGADQAGATPLHLQTGAQGMAGQASVEHDDAVGVEFLQEVAHGLADWRYDYLTARFPVGIA